MTSRTAIPPAGRRTAAPGPSSPTAAASTRAATATRSPWRGQPTWTDQTITARVKVTQWGGTSTSYRAGIAARATDASNQYVFAIDASGALRLLKGTSSPSGTGATGTCGKVSPTPLAAAGTWYTMQLKIVGTGNNVSLTTTFNGTLIHDCQTTVGTLSAGPAGTYIYGPNTIAEFDDVRISTP